MKMKRPMSVAFPSRGWAITLVVLATCGLMGCASPPVPDWQIAHARASQQGVAAYLSGLDAVAQIEWARAQREARRSANADAVARTDLMACAARISALDFVDCTQAAGLSDASAATQAYARFLMGHLHGDDAERLPDTQRSVFTRTGAAQLEALSALDQAWSRLVAAGVLWRMGSRDPSVAEIAVDTASQQGWTRALGAWLQAQQAVLREAGQHEAAQRVGRRLELLFDQPTRPASP